MAPTVTGTLDISGISLEYAAWGKAPDAAPVIVMLHEGLGCVELWRDFPQRLAAATGLGVFAYSRAGYGHSDTITLPRPLDYLTREVLDTLPHVLDKAGIRCCILLGHSDGATISAIYAGSVRDERLRGLVLIAPHFFTEKISLDGIEQARDAYNKGKLKAGLEKFHRDAGAAFRGWSEAWLDPGFRSWDVTGVLDRLNVPVLAIQGIADQYGTLAQIDVIKQRSPAPVELFIPLDCKHAPHLEQPELTLEAVSGFIAGLGMTD